MTNAANDFTVRHCFRPDGIHHGFTSAPLCVPFLFAYTAKVQGIHSMSMLCIYVSIT